MQQAVIPKIQTDNIPNELKQLQQWCTWKMITKEGKDKPTKEPFFSTTQRAKTNDPSTWLKFDEAVLMLQGGNFDGIGFIFTDQDEYVGIDIDNCNDEDGLSPLAGELVSLFNSYTEYSPSGNGLHIIVKAPKDFKFDARKDSNSGIECYRTLRYFSFSGNVISTNHTRIEQRENEVTKLLEDYLHPSLNDEYIAIPMDVVRTYTSNVDDQQVLEKLFSSTKKMGSTDLTYGQYNRFLYENGHQSNDFSSDDWFFAKQLAFECNGDIAQMNRIFSQSALWREKWDKKHYSNGDTYGQRTLYKAVCVKKTEIEKRKQKSDDFQLHVKVDLKEILRKKRFEELANMEAAWESNGRRGKKPSTISPIRCAIILQEYISFVLFDLEENTRLAMYQPEEGIYTNNTTLIKRVISWLEPSFGEAKANEVIYHLTNRAQVKERTMSRFLIPVKNGVFNLKTKELEPFNPDYVFTSKIATSYVEGAVNPKLDNWDIESWLHSIACGDKEIIHLLWQVISDSLNGNFTRKKAIFLLGEGNNGKGTFQELITNLIGVRNIATLKVNEFDERFKLSLLEGKTAVIGDDVPANVYIDDSSNFNSVVTGDRVIIEQKNKPIYSTVFRCSVIQSTNGMPKFKNKTTGTIRRILIVPFKADFNGEAENFKIKDEYIKDEKVLQYVLHKAINMDFEKFDIPTVSEIELEEFKQDNDPILDFKVNVFDEWGLTEVPKTIVYEMYKRFCNENGYKYISDRKFHKQFKMQLASDWTDGLKRFEWTELNKIGDLDYMGIGFPDKSKPLKTYKSEKLKVV